MPMLGESIVSFATRRRIVKVPAGVARGPRPIMVSIVRLGVVRLGFWVSGRWFRGGEEISVDVRGGFGPRVIHIRPVGGVAKNLERRRGTQRGEPVAVVVRLRLQPGGPDSHGALRRIQR